MTNKVLTGNAAIALGLVENHCRLVAAYPGSPSSEILSHLVELKNQYCRRIYTEWEINEKVAYEIALAASWSGLRSAVVMKQVGLNVAADPLYNSAYTGTKGGFIVISADDPGPYSSQTEQDSRLVAMSAKIPVFDPASPLEAREMIETAFVLSEAYRVPVLLRPVTRLCHAIQDICLNRSVAGESESIQFQFEREPERWTATPKYRYLLHQDLNKKLSKVETEFVNSPFNLIINEDMQAEIGIIAAGVTFNMVDQVLRNIGRKAPILKIGTVFPSPKMILDQFISRHKKVLIFEEPGVCIERQISDLSRVYGRINGIIPGEGEITPDIIYAILKRFLYENDNPIKSVSHVQEMERTIGNMTLPVAYPRLCPGCTHRSVFFALRKEFGSHAIFSGDIGCYTLGTNMHAVDTFLNMGASISMAEGFYRVSRLSDDQRPIIATIGDSTFFHSGIPAVVNAVHSRARFVIIILDNGTTAMSGFQPTCESTTLVNSQHPATAIDCCDIVKGCGVDYVREIDPYDHDLLRETVRDAYQHSKKPDGGIAVVIAKRSCIVRIPADFVKIPVAVDENCDECGYCVKYFECPALDFHAESKKLEINADICVNCGQCIYACDKNHIFPLKSMEASGAR